MRHNSTRVEHNFLIHPPFIFNNIHFRSVHVPYLIYGIIQVEYAHRKNHGGKSLVPIVDGADLPEFSFEVYIAYWIRSCPPNAPLLILIITVRCSAVN